MYFTYVVRPGELPLGRSPQCRPLWDGLMSFNLRLGLLIHFLAFVGLNIISLMAGRGIGFYFFTTSSYKLPSSIFVFFALLLSLQMVGGAALMNGFRNLSDDEGSIKYTRGYRCGVKFLHAATTLEITHASLVCIYFLSQLNYFDDMWQTEAVQPNPITIYCLFARLIHCASLLLFAAAFFYMEAYHSIGTAELWGWTIATLFKASFCLQLCALVTDSHTIDLLFTITYGAALLFAAVWSQTFEALISSKEVDMDQSALRNEWFKSRNAMAYYGPPIDQGIEMIRGN